MLMRKNRSSLPLPPIIVLLSAQEVRTLVRIADYYFRSMGPFRHVVRLTARSELRQRYSFMAEESLWLRRFAEATEREMQSKDAHEWRTPFTLRSLLAFWGRLLASLNSRRSRRKLTEGEIAQREALAAKLRDAAAEVARSRPTLFATELETRRAVESDWMRRQLQL